MEESRSVENSGSHGILEKPLTSPLPTQEYVQPSFLPSYLLLCLIVFSHIFGIVLTSFIVNEYAFIAIEKSDYPNITARKSTDSVCDKNDTKEETDIENAVQAEVSQWSVYTSLASGIPALFATSFFASLSDNYGRKRFLFIAIFGTVLKNGLLSLAIYFKVSVYWFIICFGLEGLTGSWIVTLSVSFAYIADLTSPGKTRSFYMTVYEIMIYFTFSIGSLAAGFLIKAYGYLYPELAATGTAVMGLLLVPFIPESLYDVGKREKRNFIQLFKVMIQFFSKSESNRWIYVFSMLAFIFIMLAGLGKSAVSLFYIMGSPFCLDAVQVSLYSTASGALQQIFGIAMIKVLQYCLRDETIAALSVCSAIAFYIAFGVAQDIFMLIIAPIIGSFMLPAVPMIRAMLSKLTPVNKQGSIFAVIAFAENACNLVGSVIAGAVYSNTVSIYRGFAFFVLAGFNVVAVILLIVVTIFSRRRDGYEKIPTYEEGSDIKKTTHIQDS